MAETLTTVTRLLIVREIQEDASGAVLRFQGGGHGRLAANILARVPAAVTQLDRRFGAAGMNFMHEALQARQEAIVVDAELVATVAARLLGRSHLDGDEAGAAAHPRHVIGNRIVGDESRLVRGARRHRRHHDPVLDLDRSDLSRREQDVQRLTTVICARLSLRPGLAA